MMAKTLEAGRVGMPGVQLGRRRGVISKADVTVFFVRPQVIITTARNG